MLIDLGALLFTLARPRVRFRVIRRHCASAAVLFRLRATSGGGVENFIVCPVKVNGSFISRPLTHPPLDRPSRATDKIVVNHDEMLRWYVAEVMMPYVAAQLFPPLQEFLPGLAVAIGRMSHKRVLVRPPSFACVRDWLAAPGAFEALSRRKGPSAGAAKGVSPWCVRD